LNQQATTPAAVEPTQGAYLPASTTDQQILDLIAENPATTDVAAVETPVEVDADIPRVEVSGVGNVEPTQGAYLPDSTTISDTLSEVSPELISTPVAELYDSTMEDQSQAETDRLTRQEQEILDSINPAPVVTEPTQGAYLPTTDIVATDEAPITDTGLVDTSTVSDADQQILDLISEELAADTTTDTTTEEEAAAVDGTERGAYLPDSGSDTTTDTTTTTTKPDIFTTTYLSPKKRTASSASALGSALGTTGLTASRGAGEIEGAGTGKPRKKVWNEESLKLKDALGV
jgi:hypothetical protein